jgi:GNAT superfamily N-acetyltransferase
VRLEDLRPGWRTDFILHQLDALVTERPDCIVVRTPANPRYYWGNCLILPHAPHDEDLAHWLARFDEEIVQPQPESRHVALGINANPQGEELPSWRAAGFGIDHGAVLTMRPGQLMPLPRPARGDVQLRRIDFARELDDIVTLECAETHGFEASGYREYRIKQFERYALLHAQGRCEWFGLWCDGVLAADCGLMREEARPGSIGRFQRVATHPAWRRRGLCTALVHFVSRFLFDRWKVAQGFMVADPHDVAIGIYQSLGWQRADTEWVLERRAPQDAQA